MQARLATARARAARGRCRRRCYGDRGDHGHVDGRADGTGRGQKRGEDEAELADLAEPDRQLERTRADGRTAGDDVRGDDLGTDDEGQEEPQPAEARCQVARVDEGPDGDEEEDREEVAEGQQLAPRFA